MMECCSAAWTISTASTTDIDRAILIDVIGHGELKENSVHTGIVTKASQCIEQLCLVDVCGQMEMTGSDPAILGHFDLRFHVYTRGGILTDLD